MAQQTYSVRLWTMPESSGFPPPSPVIGPTVPAGFTWVVRDVRMFNASPNSQLLVTPILLSFNGSVVVCQSPAYQSIVGEMYHWHGRAIGFAGDVLSASLQDAGWNLIVDGYRLSS